MKKTPIITFLGSLLLAACSTPQSPGLEPCPESRPNICTREYRPVCGETATGQQRTFSNHCEACAVEAVVGYREGACGK